MANYPFKINIQYKNGVVKSHYTASFATDAETSLSASAMVDKINSMYLADTYSQDNEAQDPAFGGRVYDDSGFGITYLSASYTHPNTGSVVFKDTETTSNDGLDFYTFWGTKVCNVLGLPEGIPIYTENFKLSDDSSNPSNYLSGDVIADGVAIKESFKLAPQARMRSNLVWDHQFGEGFLQWVSGSASKLLFGYDDQDDEYLLTAASAATFNISGVDSLTATTGSFTTGNFTNVSTEQLARYNNILLIGDEATAKPLAGTVVFGANLTTEASTPLFVKDYARIDALRVGTTSTDPGDGNLFVESTGSFGRVEVTGTITAAGAIFNETGTSTDDFRVESDGYANMLFVNAGTNQVSINSDTTSIPFEGDVDRDFKHDSPFTVFSTGELGGTTNDTVGMATFGYENTGGNGAYLEFFGRRNDTGTDWTTAGTRIQHMVDNVGQGYIEFNGEAGSYGMSLGTSPSSTSVNAYITSSGIILDGEGHVTMPRQSAFLAYNSSTDSNKSTNTIHTVEFNTEVFDQNADFDNSADTFTAPVDGKYMLGFHLRLAGIDTAATRLYCGITTSNRTHTGPLIDPNYSADLSYFSMGESTIADMDAGDTAYITLYVNNGAASTDIYGTSSPQTRFYGYLVA